MTKFRKCLLRIFAFYMLIYSLIRMEMITASDLARSGKLMFVLIVLFIEMGIIYYASCLWLPSDEYPDKSNVASVKAYKKTLIYSLLYSLFAICCIALDLNLVPSYYTGIMYNTIIFSDLVAFVCFGSSISNYILNRQLASGGI
ncbi:MAG: hypothetical protein MJ246_02255 [Clostridia bacterium]|nr:hypothetical protein [Clostridia bacterium]